MKKIINLFALALLMILGACTYNISMANTSGRADDVIDETATNSTNVSPDITVPAL